MAIVVIATMVVVTMTIMAVSGGDDGYDYCYDDDGGDGDKIGSTSLFICHTFHIRNHPHPPCCLAEPI